MFKLRKKYKEFASRLIIFIVAFFIVYKVYLILLIGTLLLAFKVTVLYCGKFPNLEQFVDNLF